MQYYDMHSHILPEFDDGAKTVKQSLAMLDCLKNQGVKNVCLTPHFYTNEISLEDFVEARAAAFDKFKQYIPEDMNIVLGTEVYISRYIFSNRDLSAITYGKSKYILTEFPYNSTFSGKTIDMLESYICVYGLKPVIPHIERYPAFLEQSAISALRELGVLIQTNVSNFTKKASMFKKRKLLRLVSEGYIDIIGTDAHSFEHNSPEYYLDAINCIEAKCGKQAVKRMMSKAETIFEEALGSEN